MSVFFENEDDPGFKSGQAIHWNGKVWIIESTRYNERGVWLSLIVW